MPSPRATLPPHTATPLLLTQVSLAPVPSHPTLLPSSSYAYHRYAVLYSDHAAHVASGSVDRDHDSLSIWFSATFTYDGGHFSQVHATSFELSNLAERTVYTFAVRAYNARGWSPVSDASKPLTMPACGAARPQPPREAPRLVQLGACSARLEWIQ